MYFQPGEPPGSVEDDHIPFLRRGTALCRDEWGQLGLALAPSQYWGLVTIYSPLLNVFICKLVSHSPEGTKCANVCKELVRNSVQHMEGIQEMLTTTIHATTITACIHCFVFETGSSGWLELIV